MRRIFAVAAAALLLASPLVLADEASDRRLEELEKKLDSQAREIEALKRERPPELAPVSSVVPASAGKGAIDWGYDGGFFVKGDIEGARYTLRPRALIQLDYRAHPGAAVNAAYPQKVPDDQFIVPRARVGFAGQFSFFEFELLVDPVRPSFTLPIADFWFQYHQIDEAIVRVGHYALPFAPSTLAFIEGPMIVGITPAGLQAAGGYQPGAEIFGSFAEGAFRYWLSAQNPLDSNAVLSGDPLVFARLELNLGGVTIGGAGIWTRHAGKGNKSFVFITPGLHTFFGQVDIRGWDQRYEIDTTLRLGPLTLESGFVWCAQERERVAAGGASGTPLISHGLYSNVGFMVFAAKTKGPHGVPFAGWELVAFDGDYKRAPRPVGLELLVRSEYIDIRDARGGQSSLNGVAVFRSAAADALRVKRNHVGAWTAGLNLYLQENVSFMFDFVYLRFGDRTRAERPHARYANELLFRAQLEF